MTAQLAPTVRHTDLDRLADRRLLRELAYVDGKWTAGSGGRSIEVCDPAIGRMAAWVTMLDAEETGTAIAAAARAFPRWAGLLPQQPPMMRAPQSAARPAYRSMSSGVPE